MAPTLEKISDLILGSIIKRRAAGKSWGVAVLAEGLIEKVGVDGLISALGGEDQLARYGNIEKDDHGNLRMAEIQFGRMVKDYLSDRLAELGLKVGFVVKDVGYELRCIDPIPFDCEYTRELGYAAVKYLGLSEAESVGAIVSVVGGEMRPLPFQETLDPVTKKMSTRQVKVTSQAFESAVAFMDRLDAEDFHDDARLAKLAGVADLEPDIFRERFGYLVTE